MNYQSLKLKLHVLQNDFPNKNGPKTPHNPNPISKKILGHCNIIYGLF